MAGQTFISGVTDCLDNFGNVPPKHRDAFKRRFEAKRNLTVEEQSQMLKAQYALITNRRSPYRHEELKQHGLVTKDNLVPMDVKEALVQTQANTPPKRGIVAWMADRLCRKP